MVIKHWFSSNYFNIIKNFKLFHRWFRFSVCMKRNDGIMGRFGGGWNWKLGIQAGGRTVLISLLIMEISISLT